MTVGEWYQTRKGQSLLVPGADPADRGQCVQAADYWLNEGFGLPYVWANAVDWWNLPGSLAGNFERITDGTVRAGDFVVYSEELVKYGHIDVVAHDGTTNSYVGYDSNWGGDKTLHTVNHSQPQYNKYILGSLRRIGEVMKWNNGDTYNLLYRSVGMDVAERAKAANFVGYFGLQDGREFKQAMYEIIESLQYGMMVQLAQTSKDVKPYDGPQLFVKE